MPPSALALAVLLHALVAAALWWMAMNRPPTQPIEEAIDITFEQPKPPEPPPPPPQKAPEPPPSPTPPLDLGLRPPAPLTADKPTQVPPSEQSKAPAAPPPPQQQQQDAKPEPQLLPPQPTPAPTPAPTPTPTPSELAAPAGRLPPEQALAPPPPPTRPPPPAPRPELRPSPLTPAPQKRPPATAAMEQPSPHRFVNPADSYSRARVADNYLWQVVGRLAGYRYQAHTAATQGITVVRVVIARDGRLLDAEIARSSGVPEFDRGVIAGVRAGSPYAPLPPEIQGASATFNLPLVSTRRQ